MSIFSTNCKECGIEMHNGYLWGIRNRLSNKETPPFCKKCRKKFKTLNKG